MKNHTCLCLQCGRAFTIVLKDDADVNDQDCPICGGHNVIEHNSQNFFESLFGFTGGG